MTALVKYCGGCNAAYDSVAFVDRLRADFPDAAFTYADTTDPTEADVVLVVCGCPVRCAAHAHLRGSRGKVIVSSPADYPLACEALSVLP